MNRREFLLASAAATGLAGCAGLSSKRGEGKILFGACRPFRDAALMKSVGYDFMECSAASTFIPTKGAEEWKKQKDMLLSLPIPVRSCNGFIPGTFRLTGPKADFAPALDYAETILRRAEEVGTKTIVFGSGGARNVPGDFTSKDRKQQPDLEEGTRQYTEFCRQLTGRVADLKSVSIVIEPLRPNESNIINFVWQGVQVCEDVKSPRLQMLADFFHMMMGRETADSIRLAGDMLKHCHIASYGTRQFPGSDPATVCRLRPYFDALKDIGYTGGVSCECGWGAKGDLAKNLEKALVTMKSL